MMGELTTIAIMGRSIVQLALLSGGAVLCVLTAVIVFNLLGWNDERQ